MKLARKVLVQQGDCESPFGTGSSLRICDMSCHTCERAFMSVCGMLRVNATFLSKNSECYWCWIGAEVTPGSCKKLSE